MPTWKEVTAANPAHSHNFARKWKTLRAQGKDIDGEARLSASDNAYWNSTYDSDEVDRIRASEVSAPVPAPLIDLSDECYKDTSFFGQADYLGLDVQWVPTISCIYGPDREFVAQYTENKDAIRDTESVGLAGTVGDFTSARGSQIGAFSEEDEYVIAEVLEDGNAVIEYVMDGYDANGDEADLNDLANYLVGAGILDSALGGPSVNALLSSAPHALDDASPTPSGPSTLIRLAGLVL
ncbi:hypothetical protein ACGLFO_01070 [Corynebacterium hesseae]|uniref:hypothetical protein n=1 Tax=Corynebacterium hesseae TaxID=2913502 RepID=UPI00373F60FE